MDPSETLKQIRNAITSGDYDEVCDKFDDLDKWLRNGGFLPNDWYFTSHPFSGSTVE